MQIELSTFRTAEALNDYVKSMRKAGETYGVLTGLNDAGQVVSHLLDASEGKPLEYRLALLDAYKAINDAWRKAYEA